MIDAESEIYDTVATAVKASYSTTFITGDLSAVIEFFPALTIVEADNSAYQPTEDGNTPENHARLMYEINCYSDLESGRKAQCKAIMAIVDTTMLGLGFTRTMRSPLTISGTKPYRMIARYTGVLSASSMMYRK